MESSSSNNNNNSTGLPKVGSRFESDGSYGTVKFVGTLQGFKPEGTVWVGVEWDDIKRGKHDGVYQGIKYFECEKKPNAGSFLKPEKVSQGVSLLAAVEEKYGDKKYDEENMYVLSVREQVVPVQFVGKQSAFDWYSNLSKLSILGLPGMKISHINPAPSISSCITNVTELDLSSNLLFLWHDIFNLANQLPRLKLLNLSFNKLSRLSQEMVHPEKTPFSQLRILVLNNTQITWGEVEILNKILPVIEELHLVKNGIQRFEGDENNTTLQTLRLLNLETNGIDDWVSVWKRFHYLPNLESLILNDNNLKGIFVPPSDNSGLGFSSLQSISLNHNQISSLETLSVLNKLPKIQSLRISNNPAFAGMRTYASRLLIAGRIASLKVLNGSDVSKKEREEADQQYLRDIHIEVLRATSNNDTNNNNNAGASSSDSEITQITQQITSQHSRYAELVEKYGVPEITLQSISQSTSEYVMVTLCHETGEVRKKVPPSLTIASLKHLVMRTFDLLENTEPTTFKFRQLFLIKEEAVVSTQSTGVGTLSFDHQLNHTLVLIALTRSHNYH
eukprot:TRINITY_DN1588_c0_g1_i1.p2 TRINITY_DN1588_c0_g1~~TRINITY_DN1588_c0_g1_i1.p2  ORF type:complete len:561 (-),score=116.57 TRINITY_DN1588_c0_g1_i1:2612-4294(-)